MGWVVNVTPWPLYPRGRPGAHCIGGCVGPSVGLDWCGKSHLPTELDPRTVSESRYTAYALPAHCSLRTKYRTHPQTPTPL
jgi:hypothetical protein